MTDPTPADDLAAGARKSLDGDIDWALRLLAFHAYAPDVAGPPGLLLRAVANAHIAFKEMADMGATTAQEETRMHLILDEAMALEEWLRDGGQLP
jgi:hypothetical protein